jgi:predicted lipoprotein with Yx(FWY)xxD motif
MEKRPTLSLLPFLVALLLARAGVLSADAEGGILGIRTTSSEGTFLTDGSGRPLYVFIDDQVNYSNCNEECTRVWLPFADARPLTLPPEANGVLGQFTRSDGTVQRTYNGLPLYYFVGDEATGGVGGEDYSPRFSLVRVHLGS